MKSILLVSIFLGLLNTYGIAQIITFDKSINSGPITQVIQTDDGGYLLNCVGEMYPFQPKFIKTDQYGYILWEKDYPEIYNPGKIMCKTLDGGYAVVGYKSFTSQNICLIKLNQNLDTLWSKTYAQGNGQAIIQLPDSTFIISSLEGTKFFLRRTDQLGNLIWFKEVQDIASILPSYLVNLNDGNFLFGKRSSLIKMNANADTIWSKTISSLGYSTITEDGFILASSSTMLYKYDTDGNEIWGKSIANIKSITHTNNGNYAGIQGNLNGPSTCNLLLIDTSGNILTQNNFYDSGEYILSTNDGGLIVGGRLKQDFTFLYAWLLKTDSDLNFTALNLKQPLDGTNLNIFSAYPINWSRQNVNYINLDYSTDNQVTWSNIINYYPAETGTFNWTLPVMPSGNVFIRISDSFNPEIFDRSDPPQNAINYQSNDYIAANEIFMWLGNNGMNAHDPRTDASGLFWPGGEDATIPAIFADGLVWGGKVNGEIRVNGSTYRYGLTPGYIFPNGLTSDPLEIKSKIFKLKKDWQYLPPSAERDRYEFDFLNWPVDVGAPWNDNNGDGVYTIGIDEPKIIGDETLFFVANDLDTSTTLFTYGSNPIGLEFQATTFGYNTELLKDVVFKKFKIINKSENDFTDVYLCYWADVDLGYAIDDYVGCDTLLNLGYSYNGDNNDEGYYGTPPPAVGHLLVQPPIISAEPTDSARYGDGWKTGFKNIPLNAFLLWIGSSPIFSDPQLGEYAGTLEFYNYMQGFSWDGSPIIDPHTSLPTPFCVPGDPVSGDGWYEGSGWPGGPSPSDHRYNLATGPLNMAPNDTQEVVIAILIKKGTDNINSITELKNYAAQIQHWYDNDFVTDVNENNILLPTEFSLSQNYPNPFNPTTSIQYAISSRQLVTLKVYDILGSEVATLVNQEQSVGNYKVDFNASLLSSGVYFYQIKAGEFVQSKKMILIK